MNKQLWVNYVVVGDEVVTFGYELPANERDKLKSNDPGAWSWFLGLLHYGADRLGPKVPELPR